MPHERQEWPASCSYCQGSRAPAFSLAGASRIITFSRSTTVFELMA